MEARKAREREREISKDYREREKEGKIKEPKKLRERKIKPL